MRNFLTSRRSKPWHRKTTTSLKSDTSTPVSVDVKKKKYCRFKKLGIKYVDYKDGEFLKKFLNEQGKILPRRPTGTSQKFQKKVAQAVKRARHLAILPFVTDCMK